MEHQPHGVDQEMVRLAGYTRRIVGQDQVVPSEMREQPVAGGKIDPYLPLLRIDCARSIGKSCFNRVHFSLLLRLAGHAGVNIGTGCPLSLGLKMSRTACPMRIRSRSQSTMLVIIETPSCNVT